MQGRETRRKKKVDLKERDGPKENGQTLVTRGTVLGTSHTGTEKSYGLEVDPWSAIEPVPYLCAVSLSSSCEEIFEPKRMTRETHTKTSQSGSRGISFT